MSDKFENGDTVYSEHGQEWSYIAPAPGYGHLVSPVYQDEQDEEPHFGAPVVVAKVFAKAPIGKWDEQAAERCGIVDKLRDEITAARKALVNIHAQREEIEKKFKANPALMNILDFIETPPTWAFMPQYYNPQLGPIDELLKEQSGRGNLSLRLLSLFGDSNGRLEWKCGSYSDGSGAQYIVHAFKTEDEARKFADDFTVKHFADTAPLKWGYAIAFRDKHGMEITTAIRKMYNEYRLGKANESRAKIESDLAENTKTINELSVQMLK